ncbi:hypothetical protein B0H14DRAFT_3777632 [Mycena olivaceomarginata]|nr:hypothetical protein B0H14DRAFT_3777632 [Mycena olivaceomarginata]
MRSPPSYTPLMHTFQAAARWGLFCLWVVWAMRGEPGSPRVHYTRAFCLHAASTRDHKLVDRGKTLHEIWSHIPAADALVLVRSSPSVSIWQFDICVANIGIRREVEASTDSSAYITSVFVESALAGHTTAQTQLSHVFEKLGDVSTAPHPHSDSSARVDESRQWGASGKRCAILA